MASVSIIIPTYNREDTISRAIESVLSQTHQDFEIIVVDDGSTDNTVAEVKSFDNECIKLVTHDSNLGQNPARNSGLNEARGKYISYLDSDDIFLPEHLELVIEKFETLPDLYGAVITGYEDVVDDNSVTYEIYDGGITFNDLSKDMYRKIGGLSTITFKSEVIETTGYHDEEIINSTDLDFYFQILTKYEMYGINKVLCRRYKIDDSVSTDPDLVISGEQIILEKHGYKLTRKNRAERRFERVIAFAETGQLYKARSELVECIRTYPIGLFYYYHFLISHFGERTFKKLAIYPHIRQWYPGKNK